MATDRTVLCDTNILLDLFDPDRRCHADAVALLWYQAEHPNAARLTASITSFKDAYYVLTRLYKSEPEARDSIRSIMGAYVQPIDMLDSYGQEAIDSDEPDFEDALILSCAAHESASALITRDASAFKQSGIPIRSAAEFLEQEGFVYEATAQ